MWHACVSQLAVSPCRVCMVRRGTARFYCQCPEVGNRSYTGEDGCRLCRQFLDPQLEHEEICSSAEVASSHCTCVLALLGGLKFAEWEVTAEPRGLPDTTSRLADISITAAVPGRGVAMDVCVASSTVAPASGDAAQAAKERRTTH